MTAAPKLTADDFEPAIGDEVRVDPPSAEIIFPHAARGIVDGETVARLAAAGIALVPSIERERDRQKIAALRIYAEKVEREHDVACAALSDIRAALGGRTGRVDGATHDGDTVMRPSTDAELAEDVRQLVDELEGCDEEILALVNEGFHGHDECEWCGHPVPLFNEPEEGDCRCDTSTEERPTRRRRSGEEAVAEIKRLREEIARIRADGGVAALVERDNAIVRADGLSALVEQLVLYVRRAARGCDPREREAIETDLARELRDAGVEVSHG